jgi:hypothetical protein
MVFEALRCVAAAQAECASTTHLILKHTAQAALLQRSSASPWPLQLRQVCCTVAQAWSARAPAQTIGGDAPSVQFDLRVHTVVLSL